MKLTIMNNIDYRVGIYIRLSREDEEKEKYQESESIGNQRTLLMQYIRQNKLNFISEYVDDGVSGTSFDRPAFNRMIADIEAGKINMVITKDLSRLGRNYVQSGLYIENYFPEHEVRFVAILDNIDTAYDNSNNDIAPFKSILNEMYAKDTSKKINSVLQSKRNLGEYLGTAPYGYKKDPENKYHLIIDKEAANVVKLIYEKYLAGFGTMQIADYLSKKKIPIPSDYNKRNRGAKSLTYGLWQQSTVRFILSNEIYTGTVIQGKRKKVSFKSKKTRVKAQEEWTIIENHHEPIIDKELFEKVQKIRKKRKKESDKYNNGFKFVDVENNLYSGLLYCGRCGTPMYKRKGSSGTRTRPDSYLCKKYSNEGAIKDIRPDYGCKPHRIRIEYLDQIVNAYIDNLVSNPEFKSFVMDNVKAISTNKVTLEKDLNKSKQTLEKLEKQFKQVYEDKLNDLIPEFIYKDKKQELEKKIKNEKEKLQEIENKFNTLNKLEDKEELIFKAIDDIKKNGLTKEELSRLFDKIVVFDPQEITEALQQEYNLTDEMYNELYENGGLAFHLKFMYPQTITNRWV